MDLRPGQTPLVDLDNPPDWTRAEWFTNCPNTPHVEEPLHRGRLLLAASFVSDVVENDHDDRVLSVADLGAGDGGLLQQLLPLAPKVALWGYDISRPSLEAAAERLPASVPVGELNVLTEEPQWPDLVVVTEFLEHLVDPFSFVRRCAEHSPYVVASSPYTESLEHHYELHCWAFDPDGYKALLEDAGYTVVRQEFNAIFQVCLGVRT